MLVDFHCHTTASDGSLNPSELAEAMRARNVSIFAVTDHDTLAAYAELSQRPEIPVITGVEINTTYRGNEVHVLGYGVRADNVELIALLARNRSARAERVERIVAQLNRAGFPLTLQQVHAEAAPGAALGRPHVAKALVRNAHVPTIETAFRRLLSRERPGYVPSHHVTPQDAIETIASAGGVPVLAHPGRLADYAIIDEMADAGLAGLEVFYPAHDSGQVRRFHEIAQRLGLVETAGSDFHDARYGAGVVGMDVKEDDLEPFLQLVR